jgi:hypothetical protein
MQLSRLEEQEGTATVAGRERQNLRVGHVAGCGCTLLTSKASCTLSNLTIGLSTVFDGTFGGSNSAQQWMTS